VTTLYAGEPVVVTYWATATTPATYVAGVVEISETAAGSLVLRTDTERCLFPAGTWGRISWPAAGVGSL